MAAAGHRRVRLTARVRPGPRVRWYAGRNPGAPGRRLHRVRPAAHSSSPHVRPAAHSSSPRPAPCPRGRTVPPGRTVVGASTRPRRISAGGEAAAEDGEGCGARRGPRVHRPPGAVPGGAAQDGDGAGHDGRPDQREADPRAGPPAPSRARVCISGRLPSSSVRVFRGSPRTRVPVVGGRRQCCTSRGGTAVGCDRSRWR